MNVNLVCLGARLTRDPQLRYTPSQVAVCDMGVAVNEKYKDKEKAHFIDCTAFGKTAELINQHFHKGKEIFVQGRLDYSAWDDKASGSKRSKLTVVVESFQFVGSNRSSSGEDEQQFDQSTDQTTDRPGQKFSPRNRIAPSQRPPAEQPFGDEQQFKDDDIPFKWSGRMQQDV